MERQVINPDSLGEAVGPFSRAIRIGNVLYIAGTSALSHLSGDIDARPLPDGIEEQTRLTFENLGKVMDAAGGRLSDIFKVVVLFKNRNDYKSINAVRDQFFPQRDLISTAFLAELIRDDMLIEVEATALLP